MMLDNYAYLVTDRRNNKAVVIDPGHADPVQVVLSEKNIMPDAVLVTHKHWDHSGGNKDMKQQYPDIRIYGSATDSVRDTTDNVTDGMVLQFGDLQFRAVMTPGHTVGHTVYVLSGAPFAVPDSVFSGDLLFLSGCGRMFEGPASTMLHSLDTISRLPGETMVWPGHEYAKENLEFTCHLESSNVQAQEKLEWVNERRDRKLCTCPSTLSEERAYNPFMRTREEPLVRALGMLGGDIFRMPDEETRARMLAEIRERKDGFSYKL